MKKITEFQKKELLRKLTNQLDFNSEIGNVGMADILRGRIEQLKINK